MIARGIVRQLQVMMEDLRNVHGIDNKLRHFTLIFEFVICHKDELLSNDNFAKVVKNKLIQLYQENDYENAVMIHERLFNEHI